MYAHRVHAAAIFVRFMSLCMCVFAVFFQYDVAYREVVMNLKHFPAKVQVLVKDPRYSRVSPASQMEQSHNSQTYVGGLSAV